MEKFLSTLIIIFIVLYILKWLFRLIMPWFLKIFAKKMMKQAGFQMPEDDARQDAEKKSRTRGNSSKDFYLKPHRREGQSWSDVLGGEYIECEEVI